MENSCSDHFSVSAVMLKQASQHAWGSDIWSLAGLVPGLTQAEISQIESSGDIYLLPNLQLQLYPLHCDSYYHNLSSEQPMAYLVCSLQEGDAEPQPLLLTVDYDEAASYMETGEEVYTTALPEALCLWLEQFVLTHYQPEKRKKRHRQKWHDGEKS